MALLLGIVLLYSFDNHTESAKNYKVKHDDYKISPAPIPSELTFAGELVPINTFEIKERVDREIQVNTYWQSATLLKLKKSKKYFSIIEPILQTYGVPSDFKYLAVAESSLANATSPSGAQGFWQFMESTAKSYGLRIDSEVDERNHLVRSTEAACLYLKSAYEKFGTWTLAAASYNRGSNGINYDINKQMVTSYYDLHLNNETARYVPRIIALKLLMEQPETFGFYLDQEDYYLSSATREVVVERTIPNIAEFALQKGTNYHVVKTLNPWIRKNELTFKDGQPFVIRLPQ